MALIKCNECGHEVSDKASMCPNCGCPIESLGAAKEDVMYEEPKKKKGWIWALIVVLLCLIGGGGYYAYTHLVNKNNAENEDSSNSKEDFVELTPEFIKAIEKYDQLGIFSEGYAAVCKDGKWGYINTKGEEVIPCNIDANCVGPFSEGLAFVDNNEIVGHEQIFSVIDFNGNVIFKGKNYFNESTIFESHNMPYFIKGKIYVPTSDSKQDVYDKQGNKLETISWEEADSILSRYVNCSQECFFEDTNCIGEGEKRLFRRKWGVKDSVGKVLISAKYDEIATTHRTNILRPLISNGVVLVVLEEPEEGHYTDGGVYDPSIRHYGYVDLKGNDTFSEELKARCLKAEIKAMDNYKSYLASFEQQKLNDGEYSNGEYDQTSYNNERIVNIYFRYGQGSSSVEGNYGVERLTFGLYITKIRVPQGKVWIFRDYCCSLTPKGSYTAGFCDETGRETIEKIDSARKGWWREVSDMGGERFYGGKTIYMYWGADDNFRALNFEVNFIERDD